MNLRAKRLGLTAGLLLSCTIVFAGGGDSGVNCDPIDPVEMNEEEKRENRLHYQMALRTAYRLKNFLDEKSAKVAIISRAAKPREREFKYPDGRVEEGMKYGHAGIAHKTEKGWRVTHLLFNGCTETPGSKLFRQGLAWFWSEGIHSYDIDVVIPSAGLQEKILEVVDPVAGQELWAKKIHNPVYSAIANPFATDYQNSNGWVLTVIAAAQSGAKTYAAAQAHYSNYYQPLRSKMGFFEKAVVKGGNGPANIKWGDKSREESRSGWIRFVSAESIGRYLEVTDTSVFQQEVFPGVGANRSAQATLNWLEVQSQ